MYISLTGSTLKNVAEVNPSRNFAGSLGNASLQLTFLSRDE